MNARSTNRPGGRGRRPRIKSSGGGSKKSGCPFTVFLLLAAASLPAAVLAVVDVVWG